VVISAVSARRSRSEPRLRVRRLRKPRSQFTASSRLLVSALKSKLAWG
jgi:hypothetical protein